VTGYEPPEPLFPYEPDDEDPAGGWEPEDEVEDYWDPDLDSIEVTHQEQLRRVDDLPPL